MAADTYGGAQNVADDRNPGRRGEAGTNPISPRVLVAIEDAVKVEPVGEFELKGIRLPLAAYNVVRAVS